jgi:hypothetical protein
MGGPAAKMGRPGESWPLTTRETMTISTTAPASAVSYLQAVANGATKAQGFKRPTVAALQQAAKALGLPDRIDHAPCGYHVGHGRLISPCDNLKAAASALLARLPRAPYVTAGQAALALAADREALALKEAQAAHRAKHAPAAPAAPAPELPAFVTRQQQQQQPQQGQAYRQTVSGYRVAWDEPGEDGPAVAAHNAALAVSPAPLVAPGPLARKVAPARLPADVAALLDRFSLSMDGLLTVGASNAKLAKGAALAWPVILHHLPARALAQSVAGFEPGSTAPRSRIDGLQALAERENALGLALAHNGCPWASEGCAAGCLAWAGHGGMSVTVTAARARRTLAMLAGGPAYTRAILWAIARAYRQAQAKGLPLAVRLRGTDDHAWHLARLTVSPAESQSLARRYGLPVAPGSGQTLPEALALAPAGSIRLYEYSKAPVGGAFGLLAQRAAGWDVTASLAADKLGGISQALAAVGAGFRLAVPAGFAKGQPLPGVLILRDGDNIARLQCIDGDTTDHRWADPAGPQPGGFHGVAVILRTKLSRGRGAAADAFSLAPTVGAWQPLAGGGQAAFSTTRWEG